MIDSLYIAWRYVRFHKVKTIILVSSITLILFLPAGLDALVNESAEQLRRRALNTPMLVGAKGSAADLVLNSLYFESQPPAATKMSEVARVRESGYARAIPLYVRFKAKEHPIVGTTLDYFDFRGLRLEQGRNLAILGECVLGSEVAHELSLSPGDKLLTSSESMYALASVPRLKMHVVGVFQSTGTPDDSAVFVDVKTAWVIEDLGHGHEDLSQPEASDLVLKKQDNRVTANAAVTNYREITAKNVDSFHFHGDQKNFPLTAIIALPHSEKAGTLLEGEFHSTDDLSQAIRPTSVMDELLSTIIRIRSFVLAGAVLLGVATVLLVVLIFMLSLRLRRRELDTMKKLGCSRFYVTSIVAWEILLVIGVSVSSAAMLTMITRQFGEEAIRWFLL
ncbi:MAG: ABC transporter permease [Planctomycetes bacterium]|nr:ABC transporter permease [Planctomycetota bacterium]